VESVGEKTSAYKILVGKPEGTESLGRPRLSWKDNIKIYLKEIGFEGSAGLMWLRIGTSCGLFGKRL